MQGNTQANEEMSVAVARVKSLGAKRAPTFRCFPALPVELRIQILSFVDIYTLKKVARTSKQMRAFLFQHKKTLYKNILRNQFFWFNDILKKEDGPSFSERTFMPLPRADRVLGSLNDMTEELKPNVWTIILVISPNTNQIMGPWVFRSTGDRRTGLCFFRNHWAVNAVIMRCSTGFEFLAQIKLTMALFKYVAKLVPFNHSVEHWGPMEKFTFEIYRLSWGNITLRSKRSLNQEPLSGTVINLMDAFWNHIWKGYNLKLGSRKPKNNKQWIRYLSGLSLEELDAFVTQVKGLFHQFSTALVIDAFFGTFIYDGDILTEDQLLGEEENLLFDLVLYYDIQYLRRQLKGTGFSEEDDEDDDDDDGSLDAQYGDDHQDDTFDDSDDSDDYGDIPEWYTKIVDAWISRIEDLESKGPNNTPHLPLLNKVKRLISGDIKPLDKKKKHLL
jgi:hypothetical protein